MGDKYIMSQLVISLPESLDTQVKNRGLSMQQLGHVVMQFLEIYFKTSSSVDIDSSAQGKSVRELSDKDSVPIPHVPMLDMSFDQPYDKNWISNAEVDAGPRPIGQGPWQGKVWMADDFDDLPDDLMKFFTGEEDNHDTGPLA